jgi:phage terminase small subunit
MRLPARTKKTIKSKTIKDMKSLGTYKKEYDSLIDIYAGIVEQYEIMTEKFIDSDYKFQEMTADGGHKKSPIVATLESLRKDILANSDRLCLNPKSRDSTPTDKPKKSKLAEALSGMK